MSLEEVNIEGVVLLGCGKMGSALLKGWLAKGVNPQSVAILDPNPSEWVESLITLGVQVNKVLPSQPAVCILAVKPQMMGEALPRLQALGNSKTVFISIAAGTPIEAFEYSLGKGTPIIRAMPNTPASVGKGITALIGNSKVTESQLLMAETLLQAVGQTVRIEAESQMDAVTAISGSGPAYVFHLIEALAAAGEAEGLSEELSLMLAKATVSGAGQLAEEAVESPTQLRINVTSPKGTTAAALDVLMDGSTGFENLLSVAVKAAADRSRELSS